MIKDTLHFNGLTTMSRPVWKGYITFGLVNIPVILQSAEKKTDIRFKLIDNRDQAKIRYLRVNEQTGEEVPWQDIAKGYEYDKKNYILISNDELKDIAGEHSKTINIEAFVNAKELSCINYEKPYYLLPDKGGDKGYVMLREILAATKKIAIAKVIIHFREHLAAIIPCKNAIILNILYYQQELKNPEEFDLPSNNLKSYKITPKEMDVAKQLVDSMTTKWKPEQYHDRYRDALQKWMDDKIQHHKPRKSKHKTVKSSNVINFVDLLKKSIKNKTPIQKKQKNANKKSKS